MSEHRIRLRGAWDCHHVGPEGADASSSRINLPIAWPDGTSFPVQLVRQFGRPPVDPDREVVVLELRSVPGLRAIRLNGRTLIEASPLDDSYQIPLPRTLLPRNALWLELESMPAGQVWGEVALKITTLSG